MVWATLGSAWLSHSTLLSNLQKTVDLSKDGLLGDILQDLTTEVSEILGVVKYAEDMAKETTQSLSETYY